MNVVTDVNINSKIEDIFKDFKIGNITFPIFFLFLAGAGQMKKLST